MLVPLLLHIMNMLEVKVVDISGKIVKLLDNASTALKTCRREQKMESMIAQ